MNRSQYKIAVIGAGLAGSVLTEQLINAGFTVSVLDKSRGTGGRISSCRLGNYSADLGAPYLSAQSLQFSAWLKAQPEIISWHPSSADFSGDHSESIEAFIGIPRLSALTRRLIEGAEFMAQHHVSTISPLTGRGPKKINLTDASGHSIGNFDAAVVATPSRQAADLLKAFPEQVEATQQAFPRVRWVTLIEVAREYSVPAAYIHGQHSCLARIVNDSAKPGRATDTESDVWFIEATEAWSQQQIEADAGRVGEQLKSAFFDLIKAAPPVISQRTHRWLYARHISSSTSADYLWYPDSCVGLCGDWFSTGNAEGAWRSGTQLAVQIINSFDKKLTVNQNP